MRLRLWRDVWMGLALSACGGAPAWMTDARATKVSVSDAPPLAGASYVATVGDGDFGHPGPFIGIERGDLACGPLVELVGRSRSSADQLPPEATSNCDVETAELLARHTGVVFLADRTGKRWVSSEELVRAAAPIDGPAKALLAVWATERYELGWFDGANEFGSIEDGRVRQVEGGWEVAGGTRAVDSQCGGPEARETVTYYRVTLFVDSSGSVTERGRAPTHVTQIADPCHPMGRRPSDFADIRSGGTLRGHLVRALHHESESVRAFERVARELAVFGAPDELLRAAERAAREERAHAERCARLSGERSSIRSDALPVRSLLAFAFDNAREGCAGEAFAALVNVVQARDAGSAELREHFASIASDGLEHAALAYAIHAWLEGRLTSAERAAVHAARDASLAELARGCNAPPTEAKRMLGIPAGREAARLLDLVASLARGSLAA